MDKCTKADGQFWHVEHFVCSQCSVPLGGRRYVLPRSGRCQPSCVACYNALLADYCDACGRIVSAAERHVTLDARTWHATDACFRCARCRRSLLGRSLVRSDRALFCSTDCRDRKHATPHVTDDVIARGKRSRRRRSSVDRNRRKSLGDLDARESKASRMTDKRLSTSVFRLRETSI